MSNTFQHQKAPGGFTVPRSVTSQQHGQKAATKGSLPLQVPRSFQPRPGFS